MEANAAVFGLQLVDEKQQPDPSPCLTRVPRETRDQIYNHVINAKSWRNSCHILPLLLTSRQVHDEARDVMLRKHVFAMVTVHGNCAIARLHFYCFCAGRRNDVCSKDLGKHPKASVPVASKDVAVRVTIRCEPVERRANWELSILLMDEAIEAFVAHFSDEKQKPFNWLRGSRSRSFFIDIATDEGCDKGTKAVTLMQRYLRDLPNVMCRYNTRISKSK